MLPIILATVLTSTPFETDWLANRKCEERVERAQKYYLTNTVGLLMVVTGVLMWNRSDNGNLGNGASIAIGLPMAGLGFAGMFKYWEW